MQIEYPALFTSADEASNTKQRHYLLLVGAEYVLLIIASFMALALGRDTTIHILNAIVFIAAFGVLGYRSLTKPEQAWYKARALAESIKTTTWRYCMRAQPFDAEQADDARKAYRSQLSSILRANRQIGDHLSGIETAGEENTPGMEELRSGSLNDRRAFYLAERVANQRSWYETKAKLNKRLATWWTWGGIAVYVTAIVFLLVRIAHPDWPLSTEPLIVIASAIVGWMQIKKFNELAASYALTGHEIGLIQAEIRAATNSVEFSHAVNDAELAFSREHTQWVARQNS